ncbi:ZP domain-containing protein-like [Alosa alosa]|uniref:ZP domain-containing protein-like n=1 Tax=Alosa alosa TaxID=278164 RepID=UPI00201552FC|nr:ZP domain-containing protein-like [Alosa alosa]XP_048089737.1 ZP domain-containing protein-like [Alosa alosa]
MEIICLEDSIHIALAKNGKIALNEDYLQLSDPNCTLSSNGTHLLANITLTGCGTQMEDDGTHLIFKNMILSTHDPRAVIVREPDVDIEFLCKYPKRENVTLGYIAHRPPVTFTQRGFGTFTYQFEFYESGAFAQQKDPNSYPLEFDVGEMMYMQIESIVDVPNTELFAETCRATPTNNPHDRISYPIILNGCKADETVQIIMNSNHSKIQFAMEAFKFLGHHDQVFITCSVVLCEVGSDSRCAQGCIPGHGVRKREATNISYSSGHRIHKRDVPMEISSHFVSHPHRLSKRDVLYQTSGHFVSQGPLRVRGQEADSPVANELNSYLAFSVGCLLAAVALVCAVIIYRTPRPNHEMV